jgi:hypothetical protein
VGYNGRVYPNDAVTRDRIGTAASPHPLETALEQWFSFATGRHTWISVRGATLRGLISARKRGSKAAWEIDCLIDAAEDDPSVLTGLLDQVADDAGRAGAEKVFLRLPSDRDVVATACSSGFSAYLTERLLAFDGNRGSLPDAAPAGSGPNSGSGLRRWSRSDAYPTFRLYNRWTPEPVRRVEAATFREWLAARERVSPPRGTHQQVIEGEGRLTGWLRTAAVGELGRFDLMADPPTPELLDAMIDAALARLGEQSALFSLVPEFAGGLRERLEHRGFVEQREFVVLAQQTTQTVRVPQLAPAAPVQTFPV